MARELPDRSGKPPVSDTNHGIANRPGDLSGAPFSLDRGRLDSSVTHHAQPRFGSPAFNLPGPDDVAPVVLPPAVARVAQTESQEAVYPELRSNKSSLQDRLVAGYTSLIDTGALSPGDPLPSDTQLENYYGFARNTIREAKGKLQAMGLTETLHGRGTFVRQQGERVITSLTDPLGLEASQARDALGIIQSTQKQIGIEIPSDQDRRLFGSATPLDMILVQTVQEHKGLQLLNTTTIRKPADGGAITTDTMLTPSDPARNVSILQARMPTQDEMREFGLSLGTPIMETSTVYFNSEGKVEMTTKRVLPADRNVLTNPEVSRRAQSPRVTINEFNIALAAFDTPPTQVSEPKTQQLLMYPDIGAKGIQPGLVKGYADLIEKGKLAPGDSLPSENQLANFYKTRRSSVSHAYNTLAQMGLIETQQGRGVTVRRRTEKRTTHVTPFGKQTVDELETADDRIEIKMISEKDARIFAVDPETHQMITKTAEEHTESTTPLTITISSMPLDISTWDGNTTFTPSNPDKNRSFIYARMPTQDEMKKFGLSLGMPVIEVSTFYFDSDGGVEMTTKRILPADRNKIVQKIAA